MKRRRLLWILAVPPVLLCGLSITSCSVPELGLRDGALLPLPTSPNCVSSLATRDEQKVPPLPMHGTLDAARAEIKSVVDELPRSYLLTEEPTYLRYQFSSLIFRFKDDLEFHFVPESGVIHVRAAARVGHSDFGVNRARVATIREMLAARRRP